MSIAKRTKLVEEYAITARTGVRYPAAPPRKITDPKGRLFLLESLQIPWKQKTTACEKPLFKYFSFFVFEHLFCSSATPIIGGTADYVNDYF